MRIYIKIFLFFFIGSVVNTKATAQDTKLRLDSFCKTLQQYGQINGGVLVARQGNILYKKSFGMSDFENKTFNDDKTGFTLASVSKILTSTAILQLRDKHKLRLDDPVVKYIHDFPYPGITIRNLLSHTSGLPDYELYEKQINNNPDKVFTNEDILPSLKMWKKPLRFSPGEKWDYSNTNFCLLALLTEKVSGMSFQKYLQKYIFNPAQMSATYFATDLAHANDKRRAINYEYPYLYSDRLQNVDSIKAYRWRTYNAMGFVGQGNIITTTEDMLKFDNMLYSGKILKLSTLNEAFLPTKLKNGKIAEVSTGIGKASYGLGWFILADTGAGKIVWHTGGQPGALSVFIRNITKKQTVIMFDNAFNRSLYGNGFNIIAILNNKPVIFRKESLTRKYSHFLINDGVDAAFCKFQSLKADSAHYYLSEDDMNELGLQLLYAATFKNHNELSLEVLKLNTLFFSDSFNTYDSYGEALAKNKKTEDAIFMYEKSIKLNPANESGKQALKQLLDSKRSE